MSVNKIKSRMWIGNILFLLSFYCLYGGGFLDNYGYILLMGYILYAFLMFPKEASAVFFSSLAITMYCFLLFFLLSSGLNVKIVLSLFGKLVIIPISLLHCRLLVKYPPLIESHRLLIVVVLFIIAYFCMQAIILLVNNPLAMRELVSTDKNDSIIVGGGFGLPYSLSLLLPSLLPIIKHRGLKSMTSIGLILFTILGIAVILMSQYMTALLFLIAGYFFMFLSRYKGIKKWAILSVGAIIFYNCYLFLPNIFSLLGLDEFEMLYQRLDEVVYLASGEVDDASDFSTRIEHSLSSIKTFANNFLLGVGYKVGYHFGKMQANGVGMHAEWFDLLAIYGLFAILLFNYLARGASKLRIRRNVSSVMFLLLGFLNPVLLFQILFVVYYLIPIININNFHET